MKRKSFSSKLWHVVIFCYFVLYFKFSSNSNKKKNGNCFTFCPNSFENRQHIKSWNESGKNAINAHCSFSNIHTNAFCVGIAKDYANIWIHGVFLFAFSNQSSSLHLDLDLDLFSCFHFFFYFSLATVIVVLRDSSGT